MKLHVIMGGDGGEKVFLAAFILALACSGICHKVKGLEAFVCGTIELRTYSSKIKLEPNPKPQNKQKSHFIQKSH